MTPGYHPLAALAIDEATFQAQVVELVHLLGWEVLHVRRSIGKGNRWTTTTSVKGWPDLFLWHPHQGVLARELKTDSGKPTSEQVAVIASLCDAGIDAGIWRPRDFADEIPSTLNGEPTPYAVARAALQPPAGALGPTP